jgi:sugar (pentulose or hexulose) kinase
MMPDLFNFWFTGRKCSEFTDATTTQAYNPRPGQVGGGPDRQARPAREDLPEIVPGHGARPGAQGGRDETAPAACR